MDVHEKAKSTLVWDIPPPLQQTAAKRENRRSKGWCWTSEQCLKQNPLTSRSTRMALNSYIYICTICVYIYIYVPGREPPPPRLWGGVGWGGVVGWWGGWVVGWLGGWVVGWLGGWVVGWLGCGLELV